MTEEEEKSSIAKSNESQPSTADRLAEMVMKGVAGGGIAAIIGSFTASDIPQKMLSAGIYGTGGAVAGAVLTFVKPIKKTVDRELEEGGDAFVGAMKRQKDRAMPGITGFEKKYLDALKTHCYDLSIEGFKGDLPSLALDDVFVPLQLNSDPMGRANANAVKKIWDLLPKVQPQESDRHFRRLAIIGDPGHGKTTLMKYLTLSFTTDRYKAENAKQLFPVLLLFRSLYSEIQSETSPDLPDLIVKSIKGLPKCGDLQPTMLWVQGKLRKREVLVMLDGLDEVPESRRELVSRWANRQMQEYDTSFILTSRPVAYEEHYAGKRPRTPIVVQKFTAEQQREFVNKWYLCQERAYRNSDGDRKVVQIKSQKRAKEFLNQLKERSELTELAQVPLLLNLLVTYHRSNVSPELPRQRLELYRGICKLQLDDRIVARGPILVPYARSIDVLRQLAWKMSNQTKPMFTMSRPQLLKFLASQPILEKEKVKPEAFLKMVVEVAELLVEKEAGEYEFPHLSFQGFFASEALIQDPSRREISLGKWLQSKDSPLWQEILPFFTSQLPAQDFEEIIRSSLALGSDAVQTSAKCLGEYRILDQRLQREILALGGVLKTSRYAKLDQVLKAGKWQEADQETWRVMLEVKDKDTGDYLTPDDLKTFPCEDLLTIDRLWVEASNGHFGFSVQKKIWEECGSPTTSGKEWDRFCVIVGWQNSDATAYVEYKDLKKNPSLSPIGELPIPRIFQSTLEQNSELKRQTVSFLAQRLVDCNTTAFQPSNKNNL